MACADAQRISGWAVEAVHAAELPHAAAGGVSEGEMRGGPFHLTGTASSKCFSNRSLIRKSFGAATDRWSNPSIRQLCCVSLLAT